MDDTAITSFEEEIKDLDEVILASLAEIKNFADQLNYILFFDDPFKIFFILEGELIDNQGKPYTLINKNYFTKGAKYHANASLLCINLDTQSYLRTFTSIACELRYAFQQKEIRNYERNRDTAINDDLIIAFKEDFDHALDPKDENFINQVVVLDALAFTHSMMQLFFDRGIIIKNEKLNRSLLEEYQEEYTNLYSFLLKK